MIIEDLFWVCSACNLGHRSVYEVELFGFVLALEFAIQNHWLHLWVEGDSQSALHAFRNPSLVPFDLRNRWYNCTHGGISILSSHIFREGNCCTDKLANHGHGLVDVLWWDSIPMFIRDDFYRDRFGLPRFRFP